MDTFCYLPEMKICVSAAGERKLEAKSIQTLVYYIEIFPPHTPVHRSSRPSQLCKLELEGMGLAGGTCVG